GALGYQGALDYVLLRTRARHQQDVDPAVLRRRVARVEQDGVTGPDGGLHAVARAVHHRQVLRVQALPGERVPAELGLVGLRVLDRLRPGAQARGVRVAGHVDPVVIVRGLRRRGLGRGVGSGT